MPGGRSRGPACADMVINVRDRGVASSHAAFDGVDVVVNACGIEDPAVAVIATDHGAGSVDIAATADAATANDVAALERHLPARPAVVSVGLAPA